MSKFKKILNLLIEICYLGVIFLIPLYFAIFLPNNNIFEFNKLILFKILTLLLFLFSLAKILLFENLSIIKFFFNRKFFVILIFFISLVLATVFSIDKEISFFGLYTRFQGLESYVYYILFFGLVYINLLLFQKDYQNIKIKINKIIIFSLASSFFVSFYAVAQYFGYDFFVWVEPAVITKRAFSTLGQPNYLASYLLLIIPLSFYFYFQVKKFLYKFFILIILFFQILALIFSGSRGGLLGFLFSLFVFGLIYLVYNFKKEKVFIKNKKIFYYLIFSILSLIIVFSVIFKGASVVNRFSDIRDFKSGSIALRIEYWKASLEAIREKPFFGYGLDAQKEVFAKYYSKDWAIYTDINTVPHRAHNLFFDILLTSGIAGLLAYLALLYVFLKLCIKFYKKNNKFSLLSLCILAGVFGYLFSLIFNFAIVVTQIYFWLFFALLFAIFDYEKFNNYEFKPKYRVIKIIILLAFTGLIFYQINQEFKYLKADHFFRGMKQSFIEKNYFEVLEYWSYIKEENLAHNYYEKEAGLMITDLVQSQKEEFFKQTGRKELEEILPKINNDNYSNIFLKAQIYWTLGDSERAEKFFKEIIELSSEKPKSYREFARFYHSVDYYNQGIEYYRKALEFFPDLESYYINEEHVNSAKHERYLIYKGLADIYFDIDNYELAEVYYKLALNDNIGDLLLIKKIADTYYKRGDLKTAIWYNKHGMARNQKDYFWPYIIGMLFQEAGAEKSAIEYYQKALELSPDNKAIQDILNKLNN